MINMGNIILTGDRQTGRLHLGHLVGSLSQRVQLQNSGLFDEMYIEIADSQATTDNSGNIQKVKDNVIEVALDYLSCGIDPKKCTIFLQSEVPELSDLTFYYMNLVTVARLQRNPTVKQEIEYRGFQNTLPVGFMTYPISQAADITAFNANIIPVGDDQLPMIEQTREIVRSFNRLYGETLVEPQAVLPQNTACHRLPGTDGQAKMSKSIGNCIYLADSKEEVKRKVMRMFTDPNHLRVQDPGVTEGNPVFIYLSAFSKDKHFEEYFRNKETGELEYKNLDELKAHYERGGLGDMKVKKFLNYVLEDTLAPIRARRHELENHIPEVYQILFEGSEKARIKASETLAKVKDAIGLNYRNDYDLINSQVEKYAQLHAEEEMEKKTKNR
jgi:tryptophanyl-tRNA synthetase